jgi:hypothetical protein
MSPLDTWSLTQLSWLIPLFFALHNAEEAPRMATWSRAVDAPFLPRVSTLQFTVAVALLTLFVLLLTLIAVRMLPPGPGIALVVGMQAIIFVNALTHIGTSIRYQQYSPGLVTAALINIPFSLYLFHRALQTPLLSWRTLLIALLLAPILMVGLARGALQAGAAVARRWHVAR